MRVDLFMGSVTDCQADVLVNASNTRLRLGSGVSGAIAFACGRGYQAELDVELARQRPAGFEQGDALMTGPGAHPRARAIVHVAIMNYEDGVSARSFPTLGHVRSGSARIWELVETLPLPRVSVAMVALGAGTGRLGLQDSTRAACETLRDHLGRTSTRIETVTFVGYDFVEYAATACAVASYFPEALDGLSADARGLVESMQRQPSAP